MKVFKFGGASVKDAAAVRNVGAIVTQYASPLLVVISAMGKPQRARSSTSPVLRACGSSRAHTAAAPAGPFLSPIQAQKLDELALRLRQVFADTPQQHLGE